MFCKVPYTEIQSKHRPYLEVVFSNPEANKNSSRTLAMVDSGADHTVIPFSAGTLIGLATPTEQEVLATASGVGGNVSFIQRKCRIYLANRLSSKIYAFEETVWWVYPDKDTQQKQQALITTFQQLRDLQAQCYPNTGLHSYFEGQMKQTIADLTKISNALETNVLLGRPFFDNFEFIQFCHKDRNREDRCFFNYKVAKGKAVEIIPIDQTILLNSAMTTQPSIN